MNPRLELLLLLLVVAVGLVFLFKSRAFNRFVNWLSVGTPTSVDDVRRTKVTLDKTKAQVVADLEAKTARTEKDRADLNSL